MAMSGVTLLPGRPQGIGRIGGYRHEEWGYRQRQPGLWLGVDPIGMEWGDP